MYSLRGWYTTLVVVVRLGSAAVSDICDSVLWPACGWSSPILLSLGFCCPNSKSSRCGVQNHRRDSASIAIVVARPGAGEAFRNRTFRIKSRQGKSIMVIMVIDRVSVYVCVCVGLINLWSHNAISHCQRPRLVFVALRDLWFINS